MYANDCSLQSSFPIGNILLPSGHNSDQVAKLSEIAPENSCFSAANLRGYLSPDGGALGTAVDIL